MDAGLKLKRIREKLGLRYRQVEQASNLLAQQHRNQDYVIGLSRLADIENKGVVPSLHRLYSLCAIYRLPIEEVLDWYDIHLAQMSKDSAFADPPNTHPIQFSNGDRASVSLPLKLDPGIDFRQTTYLSRVIQQWGRVPLTLLENLDIQEHRYAVIGTEDYLMYPLLPPGALVQIDDSYRQIENSGWTNEYDRPIYFFELRDGYACCWCNVTDNHLILQPHPGSPSKPVVLNRSNDVDVLGRVIGVAMQLDLKRTGSSALKAKAKIRPVAIPR